MSSVDLQEAELAMEFRCMEIVEVVLSGEKKQLRHGREGEGAKQGLHLSWAPASSHREFWSMERTIELHLEMRGPTFGIPVALA